jgi:hypothetical protein
MAAYDAAKGDYPSAAMNALGVLPFVSAGMIKGVGKSADALRNATVNAPNPTKYELAHETARKNAVVMLGLPETNTAMDRARAMGFDTPVYHGTTSDVPQFDMKYYGSDGVAYGTPSVFTSTDTALASDYALNKFDRDIANPIKEMEAFKRAQPGFYDDEYERLYSNVKQSFGNVKSQGRGELGGGANVMPLMVMGDLKNVDSGGKHFMQAIPDELRNAKTQGFDGVSFSNVIDGASPRTMTPNNVTTVFNPANLRSRFAAFDPARRHEADLLGHINPTLLGAMGAGATGAAVGATQLPDEYKSAIANAFSGR